MKQPTKEWIEGFNALCALYVYWWFDLAWPTTKTAKQRRRHLAKAKKAGLIVDADNVEVDDQKAIYDSYCAVIEAHAKSVLPPDWKPTYGYYGERCFSNSKTWHTTKDMPAKMAGDKSDHYECFASWAALTKNYPIPCENPT